VSYQLVEIEEFTGGRATIYSVLEEGEKDTTVFHKFISRYDNDYKDEIEDISSYAKLS
jgi:hypothetical protein